MIGPVDGLKEFPEAIHRILQPHISLCIVRMGRIPLRHTNWTYKKGLALSILRVPLRPLR
jgi:hypothetical protein